MFAMFIIALICVSAISTAFSSETVIKTYEETDYKGKSQIIPIPKPGECVRLPNPAKSAVTYGHCVTLHSDKHCKSVGISRRPNHGFYFQNYAIIEGDKKSYKQLEPIQSVFKLCDEKLQEWEKIIQVYTDKMLKNSDSSWMDIEAEPDVCYPFGKLRGRIQSIKTRGTCADLFKDDNCTGLHARILPGAAHDHMDLSNAKFPGTNEIVGNNTGSFKRCIAGPKDLESQLPESAVIIASDRDFKEMKIDLAPENTCRKLNGFKPMFVNTMRNCAQFSAKDNCTGASRKLFPGAEFTGYTGDLAYFTAAHHEMDEVYMTSGNETVHHAKSVKRCRLP
jgi:hypothetical protein